MLDKGRYVACRVGVVYLVIAVLVLLILAFVLTGGSDTSGANCPSYYQTASDC